MFEKLVAIEPVSLIPSAEEELHRYAKEVVLYRDVPGSDAEMVRRIGDADAVLLSYTSRMGKEVIAQCPNIRYIGMCCSLYSEESANVDIAYARTRGIQVLAGYTMKEAQIENLVTAKGYQDCVAFMGEDGISIVVSTDDGELTAEDVAKITDIAKSETGYSASGIKIMATN